MTYRETLLISECTSRYISELLKPARNEYEEEDEDRLYQGDEEIKFYVTFDDGAKVNFECFGSENRPSEMYAEFYDKSGTARYDAYDDKFMCDWTFDADGNTYIVSVALKTAEKTTKYA